LQGLTLKDQRRQIVKPASFKNGALVLNLVFTDCSSTCPVKVRELVMLQSGLPDVITIYIRQKKSCHEARNKRHQGFGHGLFQGCAGVSAVEQHIGVKERAHGLGRGNRRRTS
jgi:hypothetical protein